MNSSTAAALLSALKLAVSGKGRTVRPMRAGRLKSRGAFRRGS